MRRLACGFLFFISACSGACGATAGVDLPGGKPGVGFDDLRFSPRLGRALVPAGRSGKLDLVDLATGAVTSSIAGFSTEPGFGGGHDFGVTSVDDTGKFLLATDRTSGQIVTIDPASGQFVAQVQLGGGPDYVRWVAPTHEAWVTSPDRERIEIFTVGEEGSLTASGTIAVPGGPESLVIDADHGRAYSHLWAGGTVAIDIAGRAIVATWDNGCKGSRGIALDPAAGFLFVSCSEGRAVTLDVATGKTIGEIWPVDGIDVIDYSPTLHHLYLPGQISANVAVVGVGADGKLALLGILDSVTGGHCVTTDGAGHLAICDPDAGRVLLRRDPYGAVPWK
jgi:DNA-binding beta-propeller fold protein YncE